jgi:hypothetical protein
VLAGLFAVLALIFGFAGGNGSIWRCFRLKPARLFPACPTLPLNTAIADGRGGWFAGGGLGLVWLQPSGRIDFAWGHGRARELVVCLVGI